jgi:two-component system chemotaxis response regulator CheY
MARVLVVDDSASMRMILSDTLSKGGHEVVGQAGNGIEAVERFKEVRPDLTTLDITMPERDGLATLRVILGLDPGARVIMCSAQGQEPKVLDAIKAGATDFVVKPFDPERLLATVARALERGEPAVPLTGPSAS